MNNTSTRPIHVLFFWGLVCLYVVSVLMNLGHLHLRVEEPRRALIAMEMLESGNLLQPHTLGWEYYNKPPLFNWIMAAFMKLAGSDSAFMARLPSVFFLLLFAYSYYKISARYLQKEVALLSAFFMLTSADLYFYTVSNGAEIDIFYSFIVYLQAISIFWFAEKKKYLALFLSSWFFCALGFLTKGYPSLVFQGLTLAAICVQIKSFRFIFSLRHLAGILLFLLVTGAYFFYLNSSQRSPDVALINLLKESFLKSAFGEESAGRLYKVFTYPYSLLRVFAPWCLLLLLLFLKGQRYNLTTNPLVRFSLFFILFNIAVYWVTGAQKTRYIYMFIPFGMTIISYIAWRFKSQNEELFNKYLKSTGFVCGIALAGVIYLLLAAAISWARLVIPGLLLFGITIAIFRLPQYRLWLFLAAVITTRLIYAIGGIPLKSEKEFDYPGLTASLASLNKNDKVTFWGKPDTLNLDIKALGFTVYKWKKEPVLVLPEKISYQVPYYFYKATGHLVMFDTILKPGQTYISYEPYLKEVKHKRIGAFYDNQFRDSLVMFRLAKEDGTGR